MKIWVTGSAGFLGTRLAQRLMNTRHQVVGLSRRVSPVVDYSVAIDLASDDSPEKLRELGEGFGYPDVVVHAAARMDKKPGNYREFIDGNVLSTANLLQGLNEAPPRQLIYTSTLSIYSKPEVNPVKETHLVRVTHPYALTKRWAEQLVEAFQDKSHTIVLRLPSLYGCGQTDSFIDGLAHRAVRDETIELFARGEIVRDALHVDDVVEAIVQCIANPPSPTFGCFNLGCGTRITANEYALALVKALGSKSVIVPIECSSPKQYDLYADIEEARRQISFRPTDLTNSMKRYASELRTQP